MKVRRIAQQKGLPPGQSHLRTFEKILLNRYSCRSIPFTQSGVVFLWGQLKRSTALQFQKRATYLLLITAPDRVSVASGKIFEYIASNKKILALTRGTEAERIIKETGSGVVISPDDPIKIADCLRFILDGGQLECARNELAISSYSRSSQIKVLAKHLKQTIH